MTEEEKRKCDLNHFYELMDALADRTGGPVRLGDCRSDMKWPTHGVYFFFEPGENRAAPYKGSQRVVRVGTRTGNGALWDRIRNHFGRRRDGSGRHRKSRFRLLVGEAMIEGDPPPELQHWGCPNEKFKNKPPEKKSAIEESEFPHEVEVSRRLHKTSLLAVSVPEDDKRANVNRLYIERNSTALLSNYGKPDLDPPSPGWLGKCSNHEKVRESGLWSVKDVDKGYYPDFLDLLKTSIDSTPRLRQG